MTIHDSVPRPEGPPERRVPAMQEIMDNIWFIFLLSGVLTLVLYIVWGLIDLSGRPVMPYGG